MTEDPSSMHWRIDLYKHFKSMNLLKEYNENHYINLWQYFTEGVGWKHDNIDQVMDLL